MTKDINPLLNFNKINALDLIIYVSLYLFSVFI